MTGDFAGAREIHRRFHPLMEINFVESNPIPVKAAMAEMGLLKAGVASAAGSAKGGKSARIREVLESVKLDRARSCCHHQIEALFDARPASYTSEDRALFAEFKARIESRRNPRR